MTIRLLTPLLLLTLCFVAPQLAAKKVALSKSELKAQVIAVNELQNKVLMKGSQVADADALFARYSDDFVYIHEVYGGTYTRQHLYNNTVKFLKQGRYNKTHDRYTIKAMLFGLNSVALVRQEQDGDEHLAVFEFKGDKVSKITEYWQ